MAKKLRNKKKAKQGGRIYTPRREDREDFWPGNITPERVRSATISAGNGQPQCLIEIFRWVRRMDVVLEGAIEDRLFSLVGLEWDVVPATDRLDAEALELDPEKAKEAAAFCKRQLSMLDSFNGFLRHNAEGMLNSIGVTEIVWKTEGKHHEIQELVCIEPTALWADFDDPSQIRVAGGENDNFGELLTDHPNAFVVHWPKRIGPSPWGGGIMSGASALAISKKYGWNWFLRYTELFGVPARIGIFPNNANPDDKAKMEDALKSVGAELWGAFPDGFRVELLEAARGGEGTAHEKLIDTVDKWYSIWLRGGQLNAEVSESGGGAFALGQVHERVAERLRRADQEAESATIRDQLLAPMIEMSPLAGSPVPFFVRKPLENVDRLAEAQLIGAALGNGMEIERKFAHDRLGIPMPEGSQGDELLPLPDAGLSSFPFGQQPFFPAVAAGSKKN